MPLLQRILLIVKQPSIRFPLLVSLVWVVGQLVWLELLRRLLGTPYSVPHQLIAWDGQWYESIVRNGYQTAPLTGQANVAFFPLYPLIVKAIAATGLPVVVAGVGVSVAAFIAYLVVLYALVAQLANRALARWSVIVQALLPFGFFCAMVYTESLFLLLSGLCLLLLVRRTYYGAALAAGLASATRVTGIVLALIVVCSWLLEARRQNRLNLQAWGRAALLGLISSSGLIAFMAYLWVHTGDPIAFVSVQQYWERGGGISQLVTEIRRLWVELSLSSMYGAVLLGWYSMALAGVGAIVVLAKRRWYSLAAFMALTLAIPLSSGTAVSINRYVMAAVPFSIAVAWVIHRSRLRWLLVITLGLLAAISAAFLMMPAQPFFG